MPQQFSFTYINDQRVLLRAKIEEKVTSVLDHGLFIMGPEVRELECALSEFCGAKHTITCANGTDALQLCLMTLGIGRGDAVIVPSFTYTATAEVILLLGAEPVFAEVMEDNYNLNVDDLPRALEEAKSRGLCPKAIIGVDLFGLPAQWEAINSFARAQGLYTIADAAQAFGARDSSGRFVGTMADFTTTSFFPAKPLGCYGDGGAIFTDNDDWAAVLRSIRVHGQGKEKYETVRVGANSRLDTIQAAILLVKLEVLEQETRRRNIIAERYTRAFKSYVRVPEIPADAISAWAQYTIRSGSRDKLASALKQQGVPTAVYYPVPMHLQRAYAAYGGGSATLPVSQILSNQVLSLPMNPYMTDEEVDRLIEVAHKVMANLD